jgi:hypothetical protein
MIGDHHGRTAGNPTLLVAAMDGILGPHSSCSAGAGSTAFECRLPRAHQAGKRHFERHMISKNIRDSTR